MTLLAVAEQLAAFSSPEERRAFLDAHASHVDALELTGALRNLVMRYGRDQPSKAQQSAAAAWSVAEWAGGTPLCRASAAWAEANAHYYQGDFVRCLDLYRQAWETYETHGDILAAARLRSNAVAVLSHLGRYAEAADLAEKAYAVLVQHDAAPYLGLLELNRSMLYRHLDRHTEALEACQRGHGIADVLDDAVLAARLNVNQALTLADLGRFGEAISLLESTHPDFIAAGERLEAARTLLDIGLIRLHTGHYAEALRVFDRSREAFLALGNDMEVATVDWHKARAYLGLNLLPEAIDLCQAARTAFLTRDMARYVAEVDVVLGRIYARLGELERAEQSLSAAMNYFVNVGAEVAVARLTVEQSDVLLQAGRAAEALPLAKDALASLEARDLPISAARARLSLADALAATERPEAAGEAYKEALVTIGDTGPVEWRYRAHLGLGRLAEGAGQLADALAYYRDAVEEMIDAAAQLSADEGRMGFVHDKLEACQAAALISLQMGDSEGAFELIERVKNVSVVARQDKQSLHRASAAPDDDLSQLQAELTQLREAWHWRYSQLRGRPADGSQPQVSERSAAAEAVAWDALRGCEQRLSEVVRTMRRHLPAPTGSPGTPPSFRTLGEVLGAKTALIAYYVARGRVIALATGPAGQISRVLEPGWGEVEREIDHLRFSLRRVSPHAQRHLKQLYDWLIRPLEPVLVGSDHLVVVPHDRLFYLPFHALHTGECYLAERMALRYLPVASLLDRSGEKEGAPDYRSALVMGYSDAGRLPAATEEARLVSGLLATQHEDGSAALIDPTLYLEERATTAAFWEKAASSDVIHLATHGLFREDNPLFSALRLADGWLLLADLDRLILPPRGLVALSGCETGLGGLRGGELLGLSQAFLEAGAGAMLVSLWEIPDAATARLMTAFYTAFTRGTPASRALQMAQQALIESDEFSHPYYWAGPCLVGNVMIH